MALIPNIILFMTQNKSIHIIKDDRIDEVISSYPPIAQERLQELRDLIHETASELEGITKLEECLKWGEPSFVTKHGSTLRMDWKAKNPTHFALYFKCTSKLVETFRECFGPLFEYEKNRAILFDLDQELPRKQVMACISATLLYHKVKELPYLGIIDDEVSIES